jgi:AAHS family 4-hydroxybenzoate transporter-like MFS transporter
MLSEPRVTTVDVGRLLDEGAWTGYQRWLVFLTALAIIFDGADNQLLGNALPVIMREWSMARADFAPVLAGGYVGMIIGGALAGLAGDRFGRRTALVTSVLVFGLGTTIAGFAHTVTALGVFRFVAGLGLGGAIPNAAALSSEFVPRHHRPFAVTLTIVCVPLGGTLAGLLAIRMLPTMGWRALFVVGGVVPVLVALGLIRLLAESPRYLAMRPARAGELVSLLRRIGHNVTERAVFVDTSEASTGHVSVRALLTSEFRRDTVALWCSFFSCLLAVYLGFNWIPSMLTGAGLPPTTGSAGITAFNLGGVAGAILGALAFARIGSRPTMLTLALGAATSAAAMLWLPIAAASPGAPIVAMLGLTGGLINAVQTTMYALAAQVYPTAIRATGVGTAVAIGRSGAIVSTYAGAWALDRGGSAAFFLLVAAAMVATFVALAAVARHIPRSIW